MRSALRITAGSLSDGGSLSDPYCMHQGIIPPEKPDIRTLRFVGFAAQAKLLVEARSPRKISCAWVDFLLGAFFVER